MYTNTYTITAYTECFALGNLMFAVIPFSSIGALGNGGMADSIDSVKEILTDVSLTLEDGKFLVITGPNGGGKSTLAKIIMGIHRNNI